MKNPGSTPLGLSFVCRLGVVLVVSECGMKHVDDTQMTGIPLRMG